MLKCREQEIDLIYNNPNECNSLKYLHYINILNAYVMRKINRFETKS